MAGRTACRAAMLAAPMLAAMLAGCAAPKDGLVGTPVAPKPEQSAADAAAMMRGATGQAMDSFVQLCLVRIGQSRPMRDLLRTEGFAPLDEAEAGRLRAIPGEHWRAPGRPYVMSIIAEGAGCGMVMPVAEGDHARDLLQRALRVMQDSGQQLTVLDAADATEGPGTEHYRLRPRGAPFYLDIRLNVTVTRLNLPAVIAVVGAIRDDAPQAAPPRRSDPTRGAPLLRTGW